MTSTVVSWIFLLSVCVVRLDCEVYQDRPKIKTSDGDLILEPAIDKNIYLKTNGPKSSIYVGNIDILKLNSAKDAVPNQPFESADLTTFLNGPNGILKRLERLETKETPVQSDSTLLNITVLWRRVNTLHRKVLALQNQINSRQKDECESNPCEHGGTCLNLVDGYHCLCPSNWEGRDCDIDVNECRNFAGTDLGCQNGATCINRPGTYECLCKPNWYGLHCTRKAKDCSGGDFEMCGYGTCIPVTSGEGIKCICHQGWTSNATSISCLTDINECDSSQGPRCSVNPRVECINLPGSFRCGQCPAGYEGDGYVCYDIDECTTISNGGCSPMVTCHNTLGSRVCGSCPSGYRGDGITCTFSGTCSINHGGCHPSAQCIDSVSPTGQVAQCICPEGMEGDGLGAVGCYISTNNYTGGCETNPCGSQGRCHSLRSGYTCICKKGYGGAHCDAAVDACAINPCQHGGICRPDDTSTNGYRCECTAQYRGALCQVRSRTCGGMLYAEEGSIFYPLSNSSSTYNNEAQCAWVIHTVSDKVINVTFSKFNVEYTPECTGDFLQIHDGRKSSSQLIGRFCGSTLPKDGNIISSHNNLYLWFHSDSSVTKDGFSLHWTSVKPVCGGEIDATTHGHISSPGSPGPYPPNRDCYWHLTTTLGKRIMLHFFAFDIEKHTNCSFDYLAIYDGQHASDPLISKYCNSTQPPPIQSAGSDILIHFHSDAYGSGNGFQISYAPIEGVPGCGGYFTTDRGEVVSPTYNGKYMTNMLCEYRIKTSPDTKIRLDFKLFKLERSFRCRYDYVKIYDGSSTDSQLVGKFCGTTHPAFYTSSSNELYIIFKTDRSMASEGFRITYEAICEKTFIGDSGIIKSPSYPFPYANNKVCVYIIRTEPGKAIQLTFQDFDIEDNNYYNCRYDNVEIRDGPDVNSTLLGRYCGGSAHIPPVQTSTHNFLHIKFKSDMSLAGTGFYANYTTINIECGGIYKDTTGLINYPSESGTLYKRDQTCEWLLIAPGGVHIKLTWNRFELEEMSDCTIGDYLEITEIDENNISEVLGKYCGSHSPPAFTTFSNRLKLKFVSDSSIQHKGFSVSYTFLDERSHCDHTYIKAHGIIRSPGWPGSYDVNRDCTWLITAPVGQQISLNISNFDLERSIRGRCNLGDYLDIRNGASFTSPLIGQYCGKFRYKRITSLTNVIRLHFHSDFYLGGTGFIIEWDSTITGCGGTLTSSTGSITSPNYPNDYHENAECFYRIVTSAGSRIRISFTELDLERTPGCRDDYVEIYDGRDTNSLSLGRFCTMSTKLVTIETKSNYVYIKFRSDMYLGGKGFALNYHTICQNNITGRYGAIESPDYPNNYPSNTDCLWNIQVPKGNRINVTFTHFNIYQYHRFRSWDRSNRFGPRVTGDQGECYPDYLQMKESTDANYGNKLCGSSLPSPLSTKSNSIQIKFASSFYTSSSGFFRLEWVSYGCGGHIQNRFGSISLSREQTTEKEMECEWLIEAPPGKSIVLSFTEIYVSSSNNCSTDVIDIYNGQNTESPLLSKICHETQATIQSQSNFMLIRFRKQSTLRDIHFTASYHTTQSKCGGFISSLSGFFYSPNYPNNYDNDEDCIWYINVHSKQRIEINFIDLDLYSNTDLDVAGSGRTNCGDKILIYDYNNFRISSNYSYQICPNSNQTHIITKYNTIVIQFKSDSIGNAKGFKANFSATCGSIISATEDGIITNDKYINHSNSSCVWTIVAPALDQKISLTLTHMSLPKDASVVTNRHCPSSFIRVLDGNDKNSPLIGEYCGRKAPPTIVSRGNAITLELGSYTNNIPGKFSAHYSPMSNACGGVMTSEEGSIASPLYPIPYPVNSDCEWTLKTAPGNTAYITFEQFNLEYSEGCNEDYLEIRENDGGGPLLGVYCGNDIPSNYTKGSKIYIKFHSNAETSGAGFLLHYGYLHDNDIQGQYGEIASPLYPFVYHGSGEYTWRILASGTDNIDLTVDKLEIPWVGDLSYNKLTVFDGYDKTAPVLEQLQGVLGERKIIHSSSSVVFISLTMDDSNTGSIFRLSWAQSSNNEDATSNEDEINCGIQETQLVLPENITVFKSPNYPSEYDNDLNCVWTYRAQAGRHLGIRFVDFHLEEIGSCFADFVSLYSADTSNDWKPIKEDICKSTELTSEIESSTYMKIKFRTDQSITKKGFKARVRSKCGGLITKLSGEILPLVTDYIANSNNAKCEWRIKVRPGRTIKLDFTHFNITNSNGKCDVYVILRNGDSVEAPLLASGKYCGNEHEKKTDILTSSNSFFVSYTSTKHMYPTSFQSFKIYYEEKSEECGLTSTLTADHGWESISSPNYPNVPVPYTECVWVFTAPPGEIVRIDFIDRFDLDYTDNCGTEYVEIRDGSSSLSPMIKGRRHCGQKPATIKSTGNTMYVKYFTQLAVPRDGFKANVSIDVCGGTTFADVGEVTSPGYPQMQVLPYGTVCEWRVIGPPRHVFVIKLKDIELPESESYCATKIEIEEIIPVNNTLTILKTICSEDISSAADIVETSSNNFTIKLTYGKPDEWEQTSQSRGFKISFNSSRPTCGGHLTSSEGYINTPSYPQETTLRYCQWLIDVPNKSRRVRLEIIDSDLDKHRISLYNDLNFRNMIQSLPSKDFTPTNLIFESVGSKLSIYLWLNRSMTSHRFKAKFTSDEQALCGGQLSDINQELVSPDIQRPYNCEWHYNNQVASNDQDNSTYNSILVSARVTSSEARTACRYFDSQIRIRSPVSNKALTIRRDICGNTETSYRIPSSVLDITALKTGNTSFYFHLDIKSQPCGGTVRAGETPVNILSNMPDSYNDTLDCAWILRHPGNGRVEIKMEGSFLFDCKNEYLTITQGLSQNIPNIGHYCETNVMKQTLTTRYSYMYIEYHSKAKSSNNIKLMASTVTNQCGGYLTSFQNMFASPNYPKPYPSNQECVWEIRAQLGYRVSLKFIERFAVEGTKDNCTKDMVIVYDWVNDDYTEMARVCGREAPPPLNSTYNRMKVVLRSNGQTNLDGFKANWVPICGGNYEAMKKEQILYSPGYPYAYRGNMDCSYQISSSNNQKVHLRFLEFELEGSMPDCLSDNLTISAQSDYNYLYSVHCGRELPASVRSYESITLRLMTDRFLHRKGFKMSFSIFTCGGRINDTAVISSTFDNEVYDENMNCTWFIEAPASKIVVVKFFYIDLESHVGCSNDYVALYDGTKVNVDKRMALLCGYLKSATVLRSTGNNMVMEFITDSSLNYKGFKAAIYFSQSEAAGCGGRIHLNSTYVLKYPVTGNVYDSFLDCHWSITSQEGTVIKITFTKFHIAPCDGVNQTAIGYSKCDCDLVEMKDGLNPNSLVIGTYCGHTVPAAVVTSQNMMSLRLFTDGELASSGFEATLTVQRTPCGQSIIPVSFTPYRLKSPGYDTGSVPRGLHCVYHLDNSAEPYNQMRITVVNLQLRPSTTTDGSDTTPKNICNKDRLLIRSSKWSQTNVTTGKDLIVDYQMEDFFSHLYFYESTIHFPDRFELCGQEDASDYYVSGSTSINLITSPDTDDKNYRGVELEIAFVRYCGRNYTEPQSRILTSYYGSMLSGATNADCYTLITAPENHTISVYFLNIIPDYSDDEIYLNIYDGNTTNTKLLVKINSEYENEYPVFSTGRYMLLYNHQHRNDYQAFDLNYVTTDKGVGCGGKIVNAVGAVTSPLFPNTYRHTSTCEWELTTPRGTLLMIRFKTFDLGTICDQNYLELVDTNNVVVRTFCSETPADYTSTDNYLKLKFHTTRNNAGKGWSASFTAVETQLTQT